MGRRRNRGRRNNRGHRLSNLWIADVSVGPEALVRVTPVDVAIEKATKALNEGPYNSLVVNEAVNGIHAHVTSIYAAWRPTRPVRNPEAYILGIYAKMQQGMLAHYMLRRAQIIDEGRSV